MTNIPTECQDDLESILDLANKIKNNTPYSFSYLIIHEKILSKNYNQFKMKQVVERFENFPALPLSPKEVLFYCFPNKVKCSNPLCENSLFNV